MLFNDDRYNEPGALTFNWNPVSWGMGPEKFSYTRESLQQAILDEMEREKWLGVCCEPNSIFIVCNQFPVGYLPFTLAPLDLIGYRLSHFDTTISEMEKLLLTTLLGNTRLLGKTKE